MEIRSGKIIQFGKVIQSNMVIQLSVVIQLGIHKLIELWLVYETALQQ